MIEAIILILIFSGMYVTMKAGDKDLAKMNKDELKAHRKNFTPSVSLRS